jgi:DmsE family decaheme c-type cytochrome
MQLTRNLKIATVLSFGLTALMFTLSDSILPSATAIASSLSAEGKPAGEQKVANADQYVGSETCAQCHADQAAHYALTAHRKTSGNVRVDLVGCEACHGGAKTHVEYYTAAQNLIKEGKDAEAQALYADEAKSKAARMLSFTALSPKESTAICLKCHEGSQGRSEERFNFRRSEHGRHGVSCNDCHSSHAPKRTEFLLRDTQPNMCYQCHADQKASFAKPFHHKVPEGGMKCSDCHNQHGGFMNKSLRNSVGGDTACLKCHADKQGPFVYEHAPIKVEGCQACHTPHGSTFPKMLTRPVIKFLCLECHSNAPGIPDTEGTGIGPGTPSFHDINNPRYANCTVCHLEIHGSNKDPFYR